VVDQERFGFLRCRSEAEAAPDVRRGRPGRRSAEERTSAVVELLSGKTTVDQLARRFGAHAGTVERWREVAIRVRQLCQAFRISRQA
jgi:hypothetical protein